MDVYIVIKTTPDGWIFGERLSDGCRAWLPSTHVKEILSERIRQRNLQRRSRLLGKLPYYFPMSLEIDFYRNVHSP